MKRIHLFILLLLLFASSAGYSQESDDSQDSKQYPTSIGYGFMFPKLRNGVNAGRWTTYDWRLGSFELFYSSGDLNFKEQPTDVNYLHTYGFNWGLGFHIPFRKPTIGKQAQGGFMLNPFLDVDFGCMGAANIIDGDFNKANMTITAAPGLDLHLPFCYVGLSMCFSYNFFYGDYHGLSAIMPYTMDQELGYVGMYGFMIYPRLTFQLNSLSRVAPSRSKVVGQRISGYTGGMQYNPVSDVYQATDENGNLQYYQDYEVTDGGPVRAIWSNVTSIIIPSYFGLKGGAEFQFANAGKGSTFLPFAGLVTRWGPFALDATGAWGTMGMNSPANTSLIMKNSYSGSIYSGTVALDLCSVINTLRGRRVFDTRKFRLLFGYRYSFVTMHQNIDTATSISTNNINYPTSSLYKPEVNYNFKYTRNFHFAVELSTISLFWDFLPANYYPYASGTMIGLSWHCPIAVWNKH